jgi:hypothetical protein
LSLHRIADPSAALLASDEPWVRHGALLALAGRGHGTPEVVRAREEMIEHPAFRSVIDECMDWPGKPITRHNDATLLMHKLAFLADWGLDATDERVEVISRRILETTSPEGALQSLAQVPAAYGGSGEPGFGWMLCDSPMLLYLMLSFGFSGEPAVEAATDHLLRSVSPNGWRCLTSSKFRGPGRKEDHCPYANLLALKALSLVPALHGSDAVRFGVEAQLNHWENRRERKHYLFGIGTDFMKLKYPHVWYDVLHVLDVLSMYPWVRGDGRLIEMWDAVASKQGEDGLFVPESVWMAWKGWDFAQKKAPCPSLSLRVAQIAKRLSAID